MLKIKPFKYVRNLKDKNKFGSAAVWRINDAINQGWTLKNTQSYCRDNIKTHKAEIKQI